MRDLHKDVVAILRDYEQDTRYIASYAEYREVTARARTRILAAVADALTSEAVLEAVIDDIAIGDRELREAMEMRRQRGWTPYSTGAYGQARSYLTAALAAAGIAPNGAQDAPESTESDGTGRT